jgi:hypothetical protein
MSSSIKFYVEWAGELAAGIRPGSETVTINFEYGTVVVDREAIEYWRESVSGYYDGATVLTPYECDWDVPISRGDSHYCLERISSHVCDFYEEGLIDWATMDESVHALTHLQESL